MRVRSARTPVRRCACLLLLAACHRAPALPSGIGTLEVTEVDLAPSTPARVARMLVQEGDRVRPGDTVAVLHQAGLGDQLVEARARVDAAEAKLHEMENGSRPEDIRRAEAELAAAQATSDRAAQELARIKALAPTGVSTAQQLDDATAAAQEAASRRTAAEESLRLVRAGPRQEQVNAQRAELSRAQAALAALTATAHDLVLTSPVDAVVISRNAEPGEILGVGVPAVTLGEVKRPYTRIYVGPAVLPKISVGNRAVGVLDGFPDLRYPGRVVAIATQAEFTPRVALTESERGDLLFGIKVDFDDTTGVLKAGLPITVTIGGTR
ncbi:MAG TPA: HlyD family efflux transporter periplasmic adaptor subunit [Gemmatimonadales bacterium]|nr:HlyD family efflux transporter periplasmic adaptor subunit [Gemmatimonadales bacterium]